MGISKKNRRKITVDQDEYYWCIKRDDCLEKHDGAHYIQILNEDKSFIIEMPIEYDNKNCIAVIGEKFMRPVSGNTCKERYPNFLYELGVTPSYVTDLITWCLEE